MNFLFYYLKGIFINFSKVKHDDLQLKDEDRPLPQKDWYPSTTHDCLVTKPWLILILYENRARQHTKPIPHHAQVSSANSGNGTPMGSPSTMLQIGNDLPDEGPRTLHASWYSTESGRSRVWPEGIKCHSLSVLRYEQYSWTQNYYLKVFLIKTPTNKGIGAS